MMDIRNIPVRVIGPGSQPEAESGAPEYIDMPRDMARYDAPLVPEPKAVQHLLGAREAMTWLQAALEAYSPGNENACANLNALDEQNKELVNQILGEGEDCVTVSGNVNASVQESVLAGVWRGLYYDDDNQVAVDTIEVGAVPQLVYTPDKNARPVDTAEDDQSAEVPNAMPILVELADRSMLYESDGTKHSINLTLLPLSLTELEYLDARLGRGPVDILSRAYGKCQVISTLVPNVWWIRFYNSMGTLILNSLEISAVPDVVAAAPEDLADSADRLSDILAPYWPDGA
jgi:hydrogenase-1 operon protein HyaF